MMEKFRAAELPELSRTLFIPLAVRAGESSAANPLFVDEKAVEILKSCDTEGIVLDGGGVSTHGILARTVIMDAEVKGLLETCPGAVVINLGAGLDTRYYRLGAVPLLWYDVDLSEVIALRRKFMKEAGPLHFLEGSVLEPGWAEEIRAPKDSKVIIIAEGLLMYFPEEDVRRLLEDLVRRFPEAHLILDAVHGFFAGKGISSEFRWGISRVSELEALHPRLRVVRAWSTGKLIKERQPGLLRLLNILPATRNRSRIIHLQWGSADRRE